MTAYQSMKAKLLPLGLYAFSEGGAVDCELKAYAAELDRLYGEIDTLYREAFIATAESYGLSRREEIISREHPEQTASQRREALIYFEKTVKTTLNDDDFAEFLENIGVTDYTLDVRLRQGEFNITIADEKTDGEKALLEQRIRAEIPAHMTCKFHYPE